MGKLIMLLSLLAIAILTLGTMLIPGSPAFWLATSSTGVSNVSVLLAFLLILHLVTNPPRKIWFRLISGVLATLAAIWTIEQTYAYHLEMLDTMAFLSASVAIVVAALERKPIPAKMAAKRLRASKTAGMVGR